MRFHAYYVLRAAGAQSFAPLEKAHATCGGLTASHRDGGFYVFLSPLPPGAEITVSCPGYSTAVVKAGDSGRRNVYLRQNGAAPVRLAFITAITAETGADELIAAPAGTAPQVLDGCTLDYGFGRVKIQHYDRAASVMKLEQPLKKAVPRGMTLTVFAEQEQQWHFS